MLKRYTVHNLTSDRVVLPNIGSQPLYIVKYSVEYLVQKSVWVPNCVIFVTVPSEVY